MRLMADTSATKRGSPWKRRALVAHRWLGIVVGLYFVVLGITGSLLVFGREIDGALNPGLLTMERQGPYKPLSTIVAAFRRAYPDAPMSYVNYPVPPDGVFNVRSGPNQASQLYVYINPYTGEIIGDRTRIGSLYGFLCYLHFYLLFGQTGWTLNGYGALLVTMMLGLGVWLWWPARRAGAAVWKSRLRVRTDAGRSRLLFDLHNAAGIYSLVFMLIFTLSAVMFAFPEPAERAIFALTGTPPDPVYRLTPPSDAERLPLDELVARADAAVDGRILRVSFPKTPAAPLTVRKEWDDWNQTRNHAMVTVNPYTGAILELYDSRQHGSIGRLVQQWAYPLHFGLWGGLATRVLYVVLGLVPAVAFVTGFWRWRLRRAAQRRIDQRLKTVMATASPSVREALARRRKTTVRRHLTRADAGEG